MDYKYLRCGHGSDEVHAFLSLVLEEWVVVWDLDGEALGVGDEGTDGAGPVLHATLDAVLVAVAQSVNQRCFYVLTSSHFGN